MISSVSSIYTNGNHLLIARKGNTLLAAQIEDGVEEYHRETFRERVGLHDIEQIVENTYTPGRVLLLHSSQLYTLYDVSASPSSPLHSIKVTIATEPIHYR